MRAVVVNTFEWPDDRDSGVKTPPVLLPLMDRPFVQHIVEYIVNQGVTEIDFILCQYPEKFKSLLGDGTRWGIRLHYHIVKDPLMPYRPLRHLDTGDDEAILLVHSDQMPQVNIREEKHGDRSGETVLYCLEKDGDVHWTGWGLISPGHLKILPDSIDEAGLFAFLKSAENSGAGIKNITKVLSFRSHADLLRSHKAILNKDFSGLLLTGREIEEGIHLSGNVNLHPTARIHAPVYIGKNCRIDRGVTLGPHAVIGSNSVVDAHTVVSGSVIFSGSYIGQALELNDVIVNKNRLINTRLGTDIIITEDILLGANYEKKQYGLWKTLFPRVAALALLLLMLPVIGVTALVLKLFRKGPLISKATAVRLPAGPDRALWKTFDCYSFCRAHENNRNGDGNTGSIRAQDPAGWQDLLLRFLPGLFTVLKGGLYLVGVGPRTIREIQDLPEDWRALYLKSKPGLITEALVNFGPVPNVDELYSAEAFYTVSAGFLYDLKILGRYLGQVVGLVPKPGRE